MQGSGIEARWLTRQFWVLTVLLGLIFLSGGSSKANVPALILLRPTAILAAAYALSTTSRDVWRHYRGVTILVAMVVGLTVAHLLPLPPDIWKALPGRDLLINIDRLSLGTHWRPLSMVPEGTSNALYALAVPIAVLLLAAQQNGEGHQRLLILLIALIAISGLLGLLQASGVGRLTDGAASEIGGLFANRNHQGVALALSLPMLGVAAVVRIRQHPQQRWPAPIAVSLAALVIVLVVVTGSRTGLALTLAASLLTPAILYGTLPQQARLRSRGKANKRASGPDLMAGTRSSAGRRSEAPQRHLKAFFLGTGLVAIFVGSLIVLTTISSRDQAISRIGQSANDPRYAVWGTIADFLPNYLPWGSGIGSYVEVYQTFEPAETLRPTYSNHAHNEWLEIALTAGIPGLTIAAAAAVLLVVAGVRSARAKGVQALFSRLGVTIIAIVAFASITDYPARTPIIAAVLAIAAVWASSSIRFGNEFIRADA